MKGENRITIDYGKIYVTLLVIPPRLLKTIIKNYHILSSYLTIIVSKTQEKRNANTPRLDRLSSKMKNKMRLLC